MLIVFLPCCIRATPPMWIDRGTWERKGPEARWTVLQPSGARVRVGGRAKGGGESTGLWPRGPSNILFFFMSGACPSFASRGASPDRIREKLQLLLRLVSGRWEATWLPTVRSIKMPLNINCPIPKKNLIWYLKKKRKNSLIIKKSYRCDTWHNLECWNSIFFKSNGKD